MKKEQSVQWGPLAISLLISLGTGALSGFLTRNSMERYQALETPPLAPPGWVFPLVWSILFALMGVAAYLVWVQRSPQGRSTLALYGFQLAVNFVWPILFFCYGLFFPAFLWLLLLIALVTALLFRFYAIRPAAGWLLLPYLVWILFAGYLNFGVWALNR